MCELKEDILTESNQQRSTFGGQMDSTEVISQLEQSARLIHDLAYLAQQHGAKLKGEPTLKAEFPTSDSDPQLPVVRSYRASIRSMSSTIHSDAYKAANSNLREALDAAQPETYDQHFLITDDVTHKPLVNRKYKITYSNGVVEGITDASGLTQKVIGTFAEQVKIEVFAEGEGT